MSDLEPIIKAADRLGSQLKARGEAVLVLRATLELAQHRIVELMEEANFTDEAIETDRTVGLIARTLLEMRA